MHVKNYPLLYLFVLHLFTITLQTKLEQHHEQNDNLNQLTSAKAKKKYIKATEDAIKDEFLSHLKNLSLKQGKLLIKLIHRETGNTSYEILKKYRGSASTMFYGIWAKFYNADIDTKFDPIDDYQIEYIIKNAKLE